MCATADSWWRRRFSRILESLLPGDYAEVDRGFLIDKICARLGIIVVRPNVNRNGQKQISLEDSGLIHRVGNTRIIIEQVCGRLPPYSPTPRLQW